MLQSAGISGRGRAELVRVFGTGRRFIEPADVATALDEALATDYDGTIARDGRVDDATLAALRRLRASGRLLVLVTGRELGDLFATFDYCDLFNRIVAENGAKIVVVARLVRHGDHFPVAVSGRDFYPEHRGSVSSSLLRCVRHIDDRACHRYDYTEYVTDSFHLTSSS